MVLNNGKDELGLVLFFPDGYRVFELTDEREHVASGWTLSVEDEYDGACGSARASGMIRG